MSNYRLFVFALVTAALLPSSSAQALTSFTVSLTATSPANWDRPNFTITNTSDAGEMVTDLSISIGNFFYNFDFIEGVDPSEAATGATLISPNRANNDWWVLGGESNSLVWAFSDFQAAEAFVFTVDIDHDFAIFGNVTDARSVLFNNDFFFFSRPNAEITVGFSDGSSASITLPDGPYQSDYFFSSGPGGGGAGSGSGVPEPHVFLLASVGLLGLVWLGGPQRPAAP